MWFYCHLEDTEPFNKSPGMSLLVVPGQDLSCGDFFLESMSWCFSVAFRPGALLLVTILYRAAAFTRKKISEMDDGVVSRGEALWDEISEEELQVELVGAMGSWDILGSLKPPSDGYLDSKNM